MALPVLKRGLSRDSTFGFHCNRCLGCCRNKRIQLNPYEIARMAKNRGVSTTDFIAAFTTTGGTVLQTREDSTCVFLGEQGCLVHSDRPLVCRLYPLGRHVDYDGGESFSQMEIEPGSKGVLDENSTIADYLREQDALPFMHAADEYFTLLRELLEILSRDTDSAAEAPAILATVSEVAAREAASHDLSHIDMDQAIAAYCTEKHLPEPQQIEERMKLHLQAIREWAA